MSVVDPYQWQFEEGTGPVVGWRIWTVHPDGWLRPMVNHWGLVEGPAPHGPAWWSPGANAAVCLDRRADSAGPPGGHAAPERSCHCGFWAARDPATLAELARHCWTHLPWTWGQVAMWGRVLECTHGWRSSHARPLCVVGALWRGGRIWPPDPSPSHRRLDPEETRATLARLSGHGYVVVPEAEMPQLVTEEAM